MTRRPNVETFNKREQLNLSKEVKSTREKINEETEKMRDTRAKLFDNRDPGAVFTGFLTAGEPFQEPSPFKHRFLFFIKNGFYLQTRAGSIFHQS